MLYSNVIEQSQVCKYIRSLRDSIKYPILLLCVNGIMEIWGGTVSLYTGGSYMASIAILPLVVTICDCIPPHISENYVLFTNPGIRRIAKVFIFMIVSGGCMFGVHLMLGEFFHAQWVVDAPDYTEQVARVVGQVGESIKFLP